MSHSSDPTVVRPTAAGNDPNATEFFKDAVSEGSTTAFSAGFLLGGNFRLEKQLGRGGMGEAWKAYDETADRHVVLKFVPKEVQHIKAAMDSVRDSFKKVHALQHQHICPVYGLFTDPEHGLYLVMKFVDGLPLDEYKRKQIEKNGKMSFSDAVQILWGIAKGLDYAHEKKVVHRDIKPQNIMISKSDGVQIIDFGLAEEIRTSMARFSEVVMEVSGTRPYMAPEQWKGRLQDARTDQYALAVTAYELIVGHPPFQGSDVGILRECVLNDEPEPIPGLPDHVNAALAKALAKKRDDRFPDCKSFVKALAAKPKTESPEVDLLPERKDAEVSVVPTLRYDPGSGQTQALSWRPAASTDVQVPAPGWSVDWKKNARLPLLAALFVLPILGLVGYFATKTPGSKTSPPVLKVSADVPLAEKPKPESPKPAQDMSKLSEDEKRRLQQKYPELDWTDANVIVLPEPTEDGLRKAIVQAATTEANDIVVIRTMKDKHRIVLNDGSFKLEPKISGTRNIAFISLGPEKLILDGNKKDRVFHVWNTTADFGGIVFTNGSVTDASGGAMSVVRNSFVRLLHCDVIDNACVSDQKYQTSEGFGGGGIMVWKNSSLVLRDVRFEGNRIVDPEILEKPKTNDIKYCEDNVGCLTFIDQCSLTATNVVFQRNYGGALCARDMAALELRNVSLIDNKMQGWSGAVYLQGSDDNQTYKVVNLFATGNTGGRLGGALHIGGKGRYILDHLTLVGNQVSELGAGICFGGGGHKIRATEVILSNSIIIGNSGGDFATNEERIDKLNVCNCIVGGTYPGQQEKIPQSQNNRFMGLKNVKLGELADFGNGIPVMPLLAGSPAIDAGTVTETMPETDITGRPRNVGKAPDIGAFEWQENAVSPQPPSAPLKLTDDEKKSLQQKYPELDWKDANIFFLSDLTESDLRAALVKALFTRQNDIIIARTTKEKHRIVMGENSLWIKCNAQDKGTVSLLSLGPEKLVIDGDKKNQMFIVMSGSNVTFGGMVFTNGRVVDKEGGAIYVGESSTLRLINCDVLENACLPENKRIWWHGFGGGGIACKDRGTLVLRDVLFERNRISNPELFEKRSKNKDFKFWEEKGCADNSSGAVLFLGGNVLDATNVVFRNNYGGAMFVQDAKSYKLDKIAVIGNSSFGGGAIHLNGKDSDQIHTVTNFFATDNTSGQFGGGLHIGGKGRISLNHLTLVNNNGDLGGGLCLGGGGDYEINAKEVVLSNSLIVRNSGKHVGNFAQNGGKIETLTIANCFTDEDNSGEKPKFAVDKNNRIVRGIDMKLGELTDFGNGVPVMPLLPGSPAIDAGTVTETMPETDITGRPRNVGKAPDIGAFEWQ